MVTIFMDEPNEYFTGHYPYNLSASASSRAGGEGGPKVHKLSSLTLTWDNIR